MANLKRRGTCIDSEDSNRSCKIWATEVALMHACFCVGCEQASNCVSRLLADECVLSRVSYYSESPMFETCKE